jgi:hypothetical protein
VIEALAARKFEFVEVPEKELASQGANVLTIRPRSALMLRGSPLTKARIEAAGCAVTIIDGDEIAFPGSGGPTCLTGRCFAGSRPFVIPANAAVAKVRHSCVRGNPGLGVNAVKFSEIAEIGLDSVPSYLPFSKASSFSLACPNLGISSSAFL